MALARYHAAAATLTLLALAGQRASGHGAMTIPPSRNAGVRASADGGPCQGGACFWFSQGCTIGCDCNENNTDFFGALCPDPAVPTLFAPRERTYRDDAPLHGKPASTHPADWTRYHPWRSPGASTPLNACGLAGGSTHNNDRAAGFGNDTIPGKQGFPGTSLPPVEKPLVWSRGDAVEVAWNIAANHGGGYMYRLCPAGEPLTEECFARTPLEFVGDVQQLRWLNGHTVEIPATRVSNGTFPAGSVWTKNPLPACNDVAGGTDGIGCDEPAFPPPAGCNNTCWGFEPCFDPECSNRPEGAHTTEMPQIIDLVRIPASLPPGPYVVGWRWDCEQTPQIWSGCGDVTVV